MNQFTPEQRRQVFRQLMHGFKTASAAEADARWAWLEAAHVVGQHDFALHWVSHTPRCCVLRCRPGICVKRLGRCFAWCWFRWVISCNAFLPGTPGAPLSAPLRPGRLTNVWAN